jgi:hypothetical protein
MQPILCYVTADKPDFDPFTGTCQQAVLEDVFDVLIKSTQTAQIVLCCPLLTEEKTFLTEYTYYTMTLSQMGNHSVIFQLSTHYI